MYTPNGYHLVARYVLPRHLNFGLYLQQRFLITKIIILFVVHPARRFYNQKKKLIKIYVIKGPKIWNSFEFVGWIKMYRLYITEGLIEELVLSWHHVVITDDYNPIIELSFWSVALWDKKICITLKLCKASF